MRPIEEIEAFALNRVKWNTHISRSEYLLYHQTIAKYFSFYKALSANGKAKCINRLKSFIDDKKFIGRGITVSEEMKILIGFPVIQMTFGLSDFLLPFLHTIIVFPSSYESRLLRQRVKGLTSESGTMSLSWKHVIEGHEDETDSINLAAHEMAHALKINTVKGEPIAERFSFYLKTWLENAEPIRLKLDANSPLRIYGKTNNHEFFSVCVETFFENPKAFQNRHPKLYYHTCFLLGQNPENVHNRELDASFFSKANYQGIRFPKKVQKDYSYHSWHWTLYLPFIAFFIAPFFIIYLASKTWITEVFYIEMGIALLISSFFMFRVTVKQKVFDFWIFPFFMFFGFGPILCALLLGLNAVIPIQDASGKYKVESVLRYDQADIIYQLESDKYNLWPDVRIFTQDENSIYPTKNRGVSIHYQNSIGILGMEYCSSKQARYLLIPNESTQ